MLFCFHYLFMKEPWSTRLLLPDSEESNRFFQTCFLMNDCADLFLGLELFTEKASALHRMKRYQRISFFGIRSRVPMVCRATFFVKVLFQVYMDIVFIKLHTRRGIKMWSELI